MSSAGFFSEVAKSLDFRGQLVNVPSYATSRIAGEANRSALSVFLTGCSEPNRTLTGERTSVAVEIRSLAVVSGNYQGAECSIQIWSAVLSVFDRAWLVSSRSSKSSMDMLAFGICFGLIAVWGCSPTDELEAYSFIS